VDGKARIVMVENVKKRINVVMEEIAHVIGVCSVQRGRSLIPRMICAMSAQWELTL
jgi:methylmalonyl-CoA mutase cobalamin-binding subunit